MDQKGAESRSAVAPHPGRHPFVRVALVFVAFGTLVMLSSESRGAAVKMPPPRIHLTWRAPYGTPRASTTLSANCSDTSSVDTLYLTFDAPPHNLRLLGVSGALLFEPQVEDSLGSFWGFERLGPNSGNLQITFDRIWVDGCESPWHILVTGHVGFTRAGERGRLDISADVPEERAKLLFPNQPYCFARVTIRHKRTDLTGCRQPMSISWVGAQFRATGDLVLRTPPQPGQRVTWNATKNGVATHRTIGALRAWVPDTAPPSRSSGAAASRPSTGQAPTRPAPADSSLPDR